MLIFTGSISAMDLSSDKNDNYMQDFNCLDASEQKQIEYRIEFSEPSIVEYGSYCVIRVDETNHNRIIMFDYDTEIPVLPVNLSVFDFEFGTKITSIEVEHADPVTYDLPNPIACGIASVDDDIYDFPEEKIKLSSDGLYPSDWVMYHTGGGLSYGERTTYLVVRVYPVRYREDGNQVDFISSINVTINYQEPEEPLIQEIYRRDLLIIAPQSFIRYLQPLVTFKENHGVKTEIISVEKIYQEMEFNGRDSQEKIKYFIKESIEKWNIKYVLLVGGTKGQGFDWNLPVRYSYVVPTEEQEYPEQSFISDLYYADIFDSEGRFSSWDSNFDDRFSVWNESYKENMDLYPDVYLGRLACRNTRDVKVIVDKILKYEKNRVADTNWFNNLLLVGGDSYVNEGQWDEGTLVIEGELACDAAIDLMPGFNPLKVYASIDDISGKTVNSALNQGAGFAYVCGHGSAISWNTHFPPADKGNWCTGYTVVDMISLKNKEKLPVTIVGGCHNGQFDISVMRNIKSGIERMGLKYFFPKGRSFWYEGWEGKCWAWWLTSKANGGAIATVANTGLGTHGDGDQDYNGVVDYLEILDGWLELRFFELYGVENVDILGMNHGETMTGYLHKFLGDDAKMDVKMVQQWELFGDPSLKMGGYLE